MAFVCLSFVTCHTKRKWLAVHGNRQSWGGCCSQPCHSWSCLDMPSSHLFDSYWDGAMLSHDHDREWPLIVLHSLPSLLDSWDPPDNKPDPCNLAARGQKKKRRRSAEKRKGAEEAGAEAECMRGVYTNINIKNIYLNIYIYIQWSAVQRNTPRVSACLRCFWKVHLCSVLQSKLLFLNIFDVFVSFRSLLQTCQTPPSSVPPRKGPSLDWAWRQLPRHKPRGSFSGKSFARLSRSKSSTCSR